VHRIGRTGRAGRSGAAISFVTPRERRLLGAIEKATRQPMVEMRMPSVEDVNVTRLTRFDDAITAALGDSDKLNSFRDIIAHYVEHHDVVEADVAAALAVVAQGDTPLLLSPDDPRFARREREREDRDRADRTNRADRSFRDDRPDRPERPERRPRTSGKPLSSYRIEVGKRHRVEPRQIVGALANEGGLSREDFGHIDIRPDFSLVELPADLPADVLEKLSSTRISGKLIEIRPDRGGPKREDRGERPPRKPRRDY
jgi:ATP-dependent RNA helicase DeaD